MPNATEESLARFARETGYRDLPEASRRAAKLSLLDTMAVAIGAHGAAGVREVLDLVVQDGGRAASSVWTGNGKVPPRSAAFANSLLASALDFDSLHPLAVVHADIVTVPAAVAVAEDRGVGGRDLLATIAVGNEILCRLGCATRLDSGWFYTSVYGSIASAAVTARLLGASAAQIGGAMGLGYLSASGTQQPAIERSVGKRMQGAVASAAGVTAGYLGAGGLSGPRQFVEGRFGLLRMYEDGDAGSITRDLGTHFESESIAYKIYPSCQCNHAAIEAMLHLKRELALEPDTVASVEVFVSEYMQRLVGSPFSPGVNPQVSAQFSIQYSIAAVLLFGRLGVNELQDAAVTDPRIMDMTARIQVIVDAGNRNNYAPVRIRVILRDGTAAEHTATSYRGSDSSPVSDSDMKEKLAMCLESGARTANASNVEDMFDAVMNIEQCPDMTAAIPRILATVRG